jgi:peptide chain release factor 2
LRPASRNCGTLFDYDNKQRRIAEIEERMGAPGFWDNQEKAKSTVDELKSLKSVAGPLAETMQGEEDLRALIEMAEEDDSLSPEVRAEIEKLEARLDDLETKALLSGPSDSLGAIISINARDGGTDANDWAEMLLRMYTLWAQKNEYEVELIDRQDDDVAGIQTATIVIRGPYAYGYLKGETGTHRLVRISPFNAEGKRQTSFASVDVTPEVADDIDIAVDWDKDVREDVFRASGAGGQHVNKTSSAIRLTHVPTGIVVQCQDERSQHKNRAFARKMLLAKLVRQEEEKREMAQLQKYKDRAKVGFGSQIRSYFQHPDQRVKDERTEYKVTQFQSVLDGDIQPFMDAFLRWRVGHGEQDKN